MYIEIRSTDPSGSTDYDVVDLDTQKRIENYVSGCSFNHYGWSEEDVYYLLGDVEYKRFEKGKIKFKVTKERIFIATLNNRYYVASARIYQ